MIEPSNFIHPWKNQNFDRFKKSYYEIKLLIKKNSKSQSRKFFLITMLEFTLAIILILAGTQTSKIIGKDLNNIDNIITIIGLIFSTYFFIDFIIKFQKINTDLPLSTFNKSYKKIRRSFQNYFIGFITTYGFYSIIILNTIFNQEQNYKALIFLKIIETNLSFYQSNSIIIIISFYTILFLGSVWFMESIIHEKLFQRIDNNLLQLKRNSAKSNCTPQRFTANNG